MSIQYKLTDEITDLNIDKSYDPFINISYDEYLELESYLHISEQVNLGKAQYFNNISDAETRNVEVSGLILRFENQLKKSKLDSLVNRNNIENLTLYADTIYINTPLHFPQTNVNIFARRLIFGANGRLDTTPNPFGDEYAKGGTIEKGMKKGADGNSAGNINITAQSTEVRERKYNDIKISESSLSKSRIITRNRLQFVNPDVNPEWLIMNGQIKLKWRKNRTGPIYIFFFTEYPGDSVTFPLLAGLPFIKLEVPEEAAKKQSYDITVDCTDIKPVVKGLPVINNKTLQLYGQIVPKYLPYYVGFFIPDDTDKPVSSIHLSGVYKPLFVMNGSDGQNGEPGGLPTNTEYSTTDDDKKVPVSWERFKNEVLSHDSIRGDTPNWGWPTEITKLMEGKVYSVKAKVFNSIFIDSNKHMKNIELGNESVPNQDNGLDAYPSGEGGKGGDGGKLEIKANELSSPEIKTYTEFLPGAGGKSDYKPGGKKVKDSTYYHLSLFIHHIGVIFDISSFLSNELSKIFDGKSITKLEPLGKVEKTLKSRDGNAAKGRPGKKGIKGTAAVKKKAGIEWLNTTLLETIAQYTKDKFVEGDRRPAKWLIPLYLDAIQEYGFKPNNFITRNTINDLRLTDKKIGKNLDFFGNPVGWIPRLSAIENIRILKQSLPAIVKVLYFAEMLEMKNEESKTVEKQLKYLEQKLDSDIKTAQADMLKAYNQLDKVKIEMQKIQSENEEKLTAIRELEEEIKNNIRREDQDQKIFTGACQLAAGICQVIPFGQPYLGSIGGGLLNEVSKFDIHSDNLLGEGVKTMGDISGNLKSFISDNKEKITKDSSKGLNEKINSTRGDVKATDSEIKAYKEDLAELDTRLDEIYGADLRYLQQSLKIGESVRTFEEADYFNSPIPEEIALNLEHVRKGIDRIEGITDDHKKSLKTNLKKLESDKDGLIKKIKKYNEKKEKKAESIKEAGETLERIGDGISGISGGLMTMMTPLDEESEQFRKDIEKAKNGKYKSKFKKLFSELDEFSARKLKTAETLFKCENTISSTGQLISENLLKISHFNDQRAMESQKQLNMLTRQYLKRIKRDAHELLLFEIYYLVKSYQYRFVEKIDTNLLDIDAVSKNIIDFFTDNRIEIPKESDFKDAFEFTIRSEFIKLVKNLLAKNEQHFPVKTGLHYYVVIDDKSKTTSGINILNELNEQGSVKFKLHELAGNSKKGSFDFYYYRIENIKFTGIRVSAESRKEIEETTGDPETLLLPVKNPAEPFDKNLSFNFGIKHSGESLIRNSEGDYYYFTTKGPEDSRNQILNIKSWKAVYNAGEKNVDNMIQNQVISTKDDEILKELLNQLEESESPGYTEHLPGATSDLTLYVEKDNKQFKIDKIEFEFHYESL